jgi:hypothetical protein
VPLILAPVLGGVLIAVGGVMLRTRLAGILALTADEGTVSVRLPPWPVFWRRTRPLVGIPGLLIVSGCFGGHHIRVRIRSAGGLTDTRRLAPGDRIALFGIDVEYACGTAGGR